jgi:transcriptional regulator with XRE-family HTH domain
MAKKFRELYDKLPAERRERIEGRVGDLKAEMPLHELREALHLTQVQLAEAMGIGQGNVSKLERRTDMYVSTLRNFVQALGGELEICARFPEGSVVISQFGQATTEASPRRAAAPMDQFTT